MRRREIPDASVLNRVDGTTSVCAALDRAFKLGIRVACQSLVPGTPCQKAFHRGPQLEMWKAWSIATDT
jgi:hypothetical protein